MAAVRADELLEERTLPSYEEVVERALRRWPAVRCCYEAGPTGFGLDRHLLERALDLVDSLIEQLERAIRETAEQGPWRELVGRLRSLRGIDTLSAVGLVAEIGDFGRFRTAEELIAFVGKVGNGHVRRLLVEAAWHARRRPKVGYELARRQRGQDGAAIERSWRCRQRLHQRLQRMAGRGKPHQKIVVACARELAGFVWAIAIEQPLRPS